jgi:riboflavin synthase
MFTGIIESVGQISEIVNEGTNRHFKIDSALSQQLQIDQSIAHEGVCLTVTKCDESSHWVTAIDETLKKSNLSDWAVGKQVNLERCMKADGRFDGHIVQGHVDSTAKVKSIKEQQGSWLFTFDVNSTELIVEKGSVCLNGTSLTCFDVTDQSFSVAIIPYTFEHTTFGKLNAGDRVNIEFDILGKYIQKMISRK